MAGRFIDRCTPLSPPSDPAQTILATSVGMQFLPVLHDGFDLPARAEDRSHPLLRCQFQLVSDGFDPARDQLP